MTSALIGAAMLVLRAALTGATSPRMTELMWLAVVVCALAALMALVSVVTMTRHPMVAFGSLAITLVFAAVAETLPAGPPRLLPLLPLLGALACILVSSRRRTVHRRAPAWQLVLGWLAFALYIPVGLLYLISGLVVPLSGIAVLLAISDRAPCRAPPAPDQSTRLRAARACRGRRRVDRGTRRGRCATGLAGVSL